MTSIQCAVRQKGTCISSSYWVLIQQCTSVIEMLQILFKLPSIAINHRDLIFPLAHYRADMHEM